MTPQIAIIGCGAPGRGQARGHVRGYLENGAEIVALCDISRENAENLRESFGFHDARIYTDFNELFASEKLDMISICLWPHLHAPVAMAAAKSGNVRAIHCEKPVAPTWSDALQMVETCEKAGVQLTFNHQRRFNAAFIAAREIVASGEIGEVVSMEAWCMDLFDWGTHWFDAMASFNGEARAKWVFGQVETRGAFAIFGVPIEKLGLAHLEYENGVRATLVGTRFEEMWNGLRVRVNGSKGILEVGQPKHDDGLGLRIFDSQNGWRGLDAPAEKDDSGVYARVMSEVLGCLKSGETSVLNAQSALKTTEIIFAAYESARRGERVHLPLDAALKNPLKELLSERGALPAGVLI